MYRIVRKERLHDTVSLIEVEAPYVARKALPGQGLPCDVGRFDFYQRHRVVQTFFSYYTVHRLNIAPFRFLDIEVDNIISPI